MFNSYHINQLNAPRKGKKLLVVDIDHTILEYKDKVNHVRPYLHEFLMIAYQHYDIAVWSASSMTRIISTLRKVGVMDNNNYKVLFLLDNEAMCSLATKPLGLIWHKYPQYSCNNTLLLDDKKRNFRMNPTCGLRIKRYLSTEKDKDFELLKVAAYLFDAAACEDFDRMNHYKWKVWSGYT